MYVGAYETSSFWMKVFTTCVVSVVMFITAVCLILAFWCWLQKYTISQYDGNPIWSRYTAGCVSMLILFKKLHLLANRQNEIVLTIYISLTGWFSFVPIYFNLNPLTSQRRTTTESIPWKLHNAVIVVYVLVFEFRHFFPLSFPLGTLASENT